MPRKPPPHLENLTGAELRRREERPRAATRNNALPDWPWPRILGPTRDDFEGLPPAATFCLCGTGVLWAPGDIRNRDDTPHRHTCSLLRGDPMPLLTVTVGPRNAYTDPDSGLRFYRWQGRDLPSVTSIRRMAGVPFGLHNWAINQVADHVVGNAAAIAQQLSTTEDLAAITAVIRRELRTAATAERDRAAALGTKVHDAAAAGMDPEDVEPELAPRLRQYRDWLAKSGAEILGSEFRVMHLTLGYAGTCDLLVRLRDGSIWVVDIKTGGAGLGKGVYTDHVLQIIGYLMAEFVAQDREDVDEPDPVLTEHLHAAAGMAVLHLADDGWEFLKFEPTAELWRAFRGLLWFAVWSHVNADVSTLTTAKRQGAWEPAP